MAPEMEERLDEIEARLAQIAAMLQMVLNATAISVPRLPGEERNWPPAKGDTQ